MKNPLRSIAGELAGRNFLCLYLGGIVSASGATITSLTLIWLVYTETNSALSVSYLGVASIVPTIVLGLLAGTLVDRINRRRLMIASDLTRAAAVLVIPLYMLWQGFDLVLIMVVVAIVGTASTVFRPATNALLPVIVAGESVQNANGLISASNSIAQMLSNAAGGLLIVLAGAVLGLLYNSATYLISALLIFLMQIPAQVLGTQSAKNSVATDLREGMRYVVRNRAILEITLVSTFLNFFATMTLPFLVVYVKTNLQADAGTYGFLLAGFSLGLAAGSLTVGRVKAVRHAGKLLIFGSLGLGLATISLSLVGTAQLALALIVMMGFMLGFINTTYFSIVQLVVPNEVLGRVLSIDEVGSYAAIPLGQIAAGILIETAGVTTAYFAAGFGVVLTCAVSFLFKDMRRLSYH